jgi:hypothetical protein
MPFRKIGSESKRSATLERLRREPSSVSSRFVIESSKKKKREQKIQAQQNFNESRCCRFFRGMKKSRDEDCAEKKFAEKNSRKKFRGKNFAEQNFASKIVSRVKRTLNLNPGRFECSWRHVMRHMKRRIERHV